MMHDVLVLDYHLPCNTSTLPVLKSKIDFHHLIYLRPPAAAVYEC